MPDLTANASAVPNMPKLASALSLVPLHRRLRLHLQPWRPAELRIMLGRAAAYSEALAAAAAGRNGGGAAPATSGSGRRACAGGGASAGGGAFAGLGLGHLGPWMPRGQASLGLLAGGGGAGGWGWRGGACEAGGVAGSGGSGGSGSGGQAGGAAAGGGGGVGGVGGLAHLGSVGTQGSGPGFWALWLLCPTVLVALDALQVGPAGGGLTFMIIYLRSEGGGRVV